MEQLTNNYIARAEAWLIITTLAYFLMNGAQIFETAVIVPKWSVSPPDSLSMFKGPYGLDFKAFWIITHIIHELTFILAIIFCWKIGVVRNWLLLLFILHMAVRVWTVAYFAPNMINFQRIAQMAQDIPNLVERANLWRTLNYIRVAIFMAISFGLLPLCSILINLRAR